jgi:hypothetical protein
MAVTEEQRRAYANMMNRAGFGVFNDEGMIAGPFYDVEAAERACKTEDGEHVGGICEEHEACEAGSCEACNAEDGE